MSSNDILETLLSDIIWQYAQEHVEDALYEPFLLPEVGLDFGWQANLSGMQSFAVDFPDELAALIKVECDKYDTAILLTSKCTYIRNLGRARKSDT